MRSLALLLPLFIAAAASADIAEFSDDRIVEVCDHTIIDRQALKDATRGALEGDIEAQVAVGLLYLHGHCGSDRRDQAVSWLELAISSGDLDAAFILGESYLYGEKLARDIHAADTYLRIAAEQGHVAAQHALGLKHLWYGKGESDQFEGLYWFGSAASLGDGFSAAVLAHIHEKGSHGMQVNTCLALDWYEASQILGFTDFAEHYSNLMTKWRTQCY